MRSLCAHMHGCMTSGTCNWSSSYTQFRQHIKHLAVNYFIKGASCSFTDWHSLTSINEAMVCYAAPLVVKCILWNSKLWFITACVVRTVFNATTAGTVWEMSTGSSISIQSAVYVTMLHMDIQIDPVNNKNYSLPHAQSAGCLLYCVGHCEN